MKRRQLAIDATQENYEEALKFSEMIREFLGFKTFSLEVLKEAMYELSNIESIYLTQQFDLLDDVEEEDINFPLSIRSTVKSSLFRLDRKYFFLTESKIKHLQELNEKTLKNPEYSSEYNMRIEDSPLSSRIKNALRVKKIETVGDLSFYRPQDLIKFRNLGTQSVQEIQKFVENFPN